MSSNGDALLRAFDAQWRELRAGLRTAQEAAQRAARRERAEVAASVPVYATVSDLPTAGQLGRLAVVAATGGLYFDDGTAWKTVALT